MRDPSRFLFRFGSQLLPLLSRWRRRRLLLLLLLLGSCCFVGAAWGTEEATLEALGERFEVLPLSEGWALRPLDPAADFRVVEVRRGGIAIDGVVQLPSQIRSRLSEDAASLLELAGLQSLEPSGFDPPSPGPPAEVEVTTTDDSAAPEPVAEAEVSAPPAPAASKAEDAADSARANASRNKRREPTRRRSDSRQSFGRPLQISDNESVAEALVVGSHLEVDGEVRGAATVVGGSARVDGEVGDDLVVVGGSIELGPNAEVDGDVMSVGGTVDRSSGSRVRGEISELAFGSIFSSPVFTRPWTHKWDRPWRGHRDRFRVGRILWPILQAALVALVLLIVVQIGRPWVDRIALRTRREPLKAGLAGLLTQLLFVPLMAVVSFVLAITIVGIPVMLALWLVVAILLVVVVVIGYTGVALTSGGFIEQRFGLSGTSLYLTLLLGIVLIHGWEVIGRALSFASGPLGWTALLLVVIGGVVQYAAVTIGLGGVMLDRFERPEPGPETAEDRLLWPPEDDEAP